MPRMSRITISVPAAYAAAGKRVAAANRTTVSALAARGLRNEILRQDVADLLADGHTGNAPGWQELVDEARDEGYGETHTARSA